MSKITSLKGKNIIFVNSGGYKKRFTLEVAKKLGINIILLNKKLDVNKKLISYFIEADTYNIKECIDKIKDFKTQNPQVALDGAVTFWEDDIPLLAKICEKFNLTGNSYQTALRTRNKYEMRKRLDETGLNTTPFQLVKNQNDLKRAMAEVGFPAVMKPAWGADSEFVVFVKNEEEATNTLDYLIKNCNEQFNPIFKYNGGNFVYEEYIDGTEVSLECFIQYGIPHVIGLNEKQPIKLPYFIEYGDICPARLDKDDEAEAVKLAESALIALGVQNSLAHIELKVTDDGPKIIEIGSRMGGDDIYLNVKSVWGDDMVEMALQIAVGMKVEYEKRPAKDCVICRYFIPEFSGIVTNIDGVKDAKRSKDVLQLCMTKNVGDAIFAPPEGFDNAGWIVVKGRSYQEAESLINRFMKRIEVNITRFHKDSSLGKTIRKSALSSASLVRGKILQASKIEKIRSIDIDALRKLHIGIITNSVVPIDTGLRENPVGEKIRKILAGLGYQVSLFDMNDVPLPINKIKDANLDLVLNLCETIHNSMLLEMHAPALLDMLQLPYTGSSPAALSMALDKIKVKKILTYHAIPTPEWDYIYEMGEEIRDDLEFPLIIKPANADDSFGIKNKSVVTNHKEMKKQLEMIVEEYKRPALIEEYIEGDEFDVCIIGNGDDVEVLPLIRSVFDKMPKKFWHIYSSDLRDSANKRALESIKLVKPAKISKKLDTLITEMAMDVYNIFDCHDYGKVEFRIDKDGNPYVLEVNPNAALDVDDFVPMAAKLAGYSYEDLLEEIIWMAVQRYQNKPPFYHLQA